MELISANGAFILRELLPVDFSHTTTGGGSGIHTLNRAVDLQVASHQHVRVYLELDTSFSTASTCTATGTLSTLG